MKELLASDEVPDFAVSQYDPSLVAQFMLGILSASEYGILAKMGQGLINSADIDLQEYPGNSSVNLLTRAFLLPYFRDEILQTLTAQLPHPDA